MKKDEDCKAYFIRHTDVLAISDKFLREQIFMKNKIMIHFPGRDEYGNLEKKDSESTEPKKYKHKSEQNAIRCFKELAENGGYVWAQYHVKDEILVGEVLPKSKIKVIDSTWEKEGKGRKKGSPAKVKTLQLENVKKIKSSEAMAFRAARPRQGTICHWRNKKSELPSLVEGKELEHKWENLSPDQQEVACAEFLRNHDLNNIPKLKKLLMPIGRTLKDIDMYGLTNDNKILFSQVTFLEKNKANTKIEVLKKYSKKDDDNVLVFFCKCDEVKSEKNFYFIPIKSVKKWLFKKENKSFEEKMFSLLFLFPFFLKV